MKFEAPESGYYLISSTMSNENIDTQIYIYKNVPYNTIVNPDRKWYTFWRPKTIEVPDFDNAEKLKVSNKKGYIIYEKI